MIDRRAVRNELSEIIRAAVAGVVPAEHVFQYSPETLGGKSPVIIVKSTGSRRNVKTFGRLKTSELDFTVQILVLYALARNNVFVKPSDEYGPREASDILDVLERAVQIAILNASVDGWREVTTGQSNIAPVLDGGELYWRESIPVTVEVYEND